MNPKPPRRQLILEALAAELEKSPGARITTATLASANAWESRRRAQAHSFPISRSMVFLTTAAGVIGSIVSSDKLNMS